MEKQYIILCLRDFQENSPKDNNFYVQCSRKRYSLEKATKRAEYISKQRNPMVVLVPSEPIPEGYKLDRVFTTKGMEQFSIEFLIPIVSVETIEKEVIAEEKAA